MRKLSGKVAAVTGAGSGIGRALAQNLAEQGTRLALSDIDPDGLAATVALVKGLGVNVTSRQVDVADRAAVEAWASSVVDDHGAVHLVCNIAGVAVASSVTAISYEDFEWLMAIDFWGVVYGTKAFLPHLEAAGEGHIVNMSSVFGLVSVPTQSAYNAAKFAVRGFTDSLRMELEIAGSPVSCTTVHPGGVKTAIARRARIDPSVARFGGDPASAGDDFDRLAMTSPEKAARRIVEAVRQNRRRVVIGPDGVLIDLVSRLPASLYQGFLVKRSGHRP